MNKIRHHFSVSDTVIAQHTCNDPPRFAAVHSSQVLSVTIALVVSAQSLGEFGAERRALKPDGLIAHRNTMLSQ